MSTLRKPLTATGVKALKVPGRYGDGRGGHGLYLRVRRRTNGRLAKAWCQRVRIGERVTNIGLGPFPRVTLAEARAKALKNVQAIERGHDPRGGGVPTFAEAAEKVIALHSKGWKAGSRLPAQWRQTLTAHAYPVIGHKRVDRIASGHVLDVLTPIWHSKAATARMVRQRMGAVMKWAIAKGYRTDDPAGAAVTAALPKNGGHKHHAATPWRDLPGVLQQVRASDRFQLAARLALEFVALTAARGAEVRGACWREVDVKARTWTVPAERVKTGKPHRVPLSDRALEVLAEARTLGTGDIVFPAVTTGRVLNNRALPDILKGLGIAGTVHGFRSSFRDWCADNGVDREVAERALAHAVRSKVEAAYARSDLLERRREVMERWGDHLGGGAK